MTTADARKAVTKMNGSPAVIQASIQVANVDDNEMLQRIQVIYPQFNLDAVASQFAKHFGLEKLKIRKEMQKQSVIQGGGAGRLMTF